MGNSLMIFKDKNMWASDYSLQAILYYLQPLIKEAKNTNNQISKTNKQWLEGFYEDLLFYLKGFSTGGIDFEFEVIAEDSYRIKLLRDNLQKVKQMLQSKGKELSLEELRKIEGWDINGARYSTLSMSVKKVVHTIDELLSMLPN